METSRRETRRTHVRYAIIVKEIGPAYTVFMSSFCEQFVSPNYILADKSVFNHSRSPSARRRGDLGRRRVAAARLRGSASPPRDPLGTIRSRGAAATRFAGRRRSC